MAQTKRAGSTRSRGNSRKGARTSAGSKRPASRTRGAGAAAKDAGRKAKTPLVAGGAALAGLVGGAVLARRNGSSSTAKAFDTAAREFGKAGYRLGQLTSEVRRVREQTTKS